MRRSPEDIQDEWLVLRCQGGEPEAIDALVARWQPRFRRLAARLTADPDAANDLAQEAWLAIVRGLRRLDDPARFRAWAYRIVTHKCADWIRRRAVRREASRALRGAATLRDCGGGPSASEEADEIARLRAALRQLPDDERTLLSLHYLDGLSVRELADVFKLPAGTIKSRLHHARGQLRKAVEESEHERAGQENR